MIISIDTVKDSKEDIQKAIELLKKLSEGSEISEEGAAAFGAVFGSDNDDSTHEDSGEPDDVQIVPY